MRDRVVESREVEVSDPSHASLVVLLDAPLERAVCVLPTPKEEDAVGLLQDIAEYNFELKVRAPFLHSCGGQIRECLEDDLVFDVQQRQRPVQPRCLRDIDALRMSRLKRATEQTLPEVRQVRFKRNFVRVVDWPVKPLVLVVAAGCDSSPRQVEVPFAYELVDLHRIDLCTARKAFCPSQRLPNAELTCELRDATGRCSKSG